MAITTFNRYEQKYMLRKDQADIIKKEIKDYVAQDKYSINSYYTICNIYYDTANDDIIKNSVSKPNFKEKLRLRCYGNASDEDIVYLEIKKKLNGFVNKRRTDITIKEAHNLIFNKVMPVKQPYHNTQILNEIYYYVQNKNLIPKIALSYDREAYFDKENPDFRITFDNNITSRRQDVYIGRNEDVDTSIIEDDMIIMELKTSTSIPLWMTRILSKHKLFSKSFSKYGSEFYDYLIANRKDEVSCLNPYLTSQAPASH